MGSAVPPPVEARARDRGDRGDRGDRREVGASFSADPLPPQVPDMKGALTEASARVRHIGALQRLDEMLMYVLVVLLVVLVQIPQCLPADGRW